MHDNERIIWAFQNNIMRPERYFGLVEACDKAGIEYINFRAYSDNPNAQEYHATFNKLPNVPNTNRVIFIGTTFLVHRVHEDGRWKPGVFFDLDNFTYSACYTKWQEAMLNFDCQFMTMGEFKKDCELHPKSQRKFFIRPDKDLKEFTGMVVGRQEIIEWDPETDTHGDNVNLSTDIIVSLPHEIEREWRLIMVGGKVSSGSQYKKDRQLCPDATVPDDVIEYAENTCSIWTPHDVFTMDICESNGLYKIVECNCFNCSGLYLANLGKVVDDVNAYIEETYPV